MNHGPVPMRRGRRGSESQAPTSDADTNESVMVSQAVACIDSFTDDFNARDLVGMDACLHFLHIILSGERLMIWENGGQLSASFFDGLARDTG
jgi:hypothetical protein